MGLSDHPAKRIYNWVYQAAANQSNTQLGLSGYSAKPANGWVYQTTGSQANTVTFPQFPQHQIITQSSQPSVGFIRPLTNHMHLYQQYTYINNALISTTNQPSQHSWVYQAINNNTCTYINNKRPFPGPGPTMDPQEYNSPTSPSNTSLC